MNCIDICKRIIKVVLIFLTIIPPYLFSEDFFSQDTLHEYREIGVYGDVPLLFKVEDGIVWLKVDYENRFDSLKANDIEIDKDGFSYASVFNREISILYGSRFFLFMNDMSSYFGHGIKGIGTFYGTDFSGATRAIYNKTLIRNIESTSSLKEDSILYDTKLLNKYLGYFTYMSHPEMAQVFNQNAHPWVEGVDGPGIGEQLIISFTEPSNDIVVLNGFVDRNRKYLFKANNRVKTAIIRSADSGEPFEFEYQFEDMVRFDEIRFPRPAEKVVFEIKDVYPGEKWDDTCISAVLTREPDPYIGTNTSPAPPAVSEPQVFGPETR
ncbi:NADase-type glycan-binding domain-containing protein [Sediminispirochaeta smaragdinae]|uniref:NAD glycohydrolase translocation F5/8 type C domain-containing protein n=1 Tax=Sediminispirochaeta smaragdinae (strain DSM 11293 / JCM 15392 / SEBR 4228) TaxID=573413 RepID=E1R173_SEDSS|nr:hypothetical protein [Sediminispirochaeta smaragdinae]ADK80893.1 hypothetical protein Spirs_1767 [Sediminispirochaeta smaragdinae DSM 11293]